MKMNTVTIFLGFYLLLQGFCNARLSDKDSSKTLGSENYEKSTLTCTCGKFNKSIKKQIPWELADGIYRNELASNSNSNDLYKFIVNIKPFFRNCSVCEVEYSTCPGDQNNLDANSCFKNSVLFSIPQKNHSGNTEGVKLLRKRSVEIPFDFEIPIGNSSQHHRHVRQADLCAFPTSLATAELKCRIYPSSVACIQRCALGYTLRNGTEMKRWCMKNHNRWYPHGFQECRPYVDCGVTLISGGKEECSTPTVKEPVSCKITCDHFENEAGGHSTHECDVNGKWTPKLPYCARPGSGMQLVKKPRRHD